MTTLYLAWRDPGRRWYPIGRLEQNGSGYVFSYVHGAQIAMQSSRFLPLISFPDLTARYESPTLFPMFANRIPSPTRDEYGGFVTWLNLPSADIDPVTLLARSSGRRETDAFELFACPRPHDGLYVTHAFIHGLRHQAPEVIERASRLHAEEALALAHESSNPQDELAVQTLTADRAYMLGYLPRYLAADVHALGIDRVTVEVERVNPPPAPVQYRVLVRLTAPWRTGFEPCSGPEFGPVASPQGAGRP